MRKIFLLLMVLSFWVYGQDQKPERFSLLANYSLYDMWLPGKVGITASYGTDQRVYEFGYQRAAYSVDLLVVDLGGVVDERYHLTTRSFAYGGSFNYQYGLYYNKVGARLGHEWLDGIKERNDWVDVSTIGVTFGIGNRWSWDNGLLVGVDWTKVFIPVAVLRVNAPVLDALKNQSRKEDIQGFISAVSRIPAFVGLHFEVGYKF